MFLKHKQWQKIEPLSDWKKPDSIQMSVLSQLFKLSHVLKDINNKLYEDYGIPTWGCYALFTVATIILSASLGLLLICIIDLFYPPKKSHRQSFSESKEKVEDIPNDEIEDDEQEDEEAGDEKNAAEEDDDEEDETSEGEMGVHIGKVDVTTSPSLSGRFLVTALPTIYHVKDDGGDGDAGIEDDKSKSSPRELRKRKPRKAD
uniref:Thioredoxin-related transmembrane protein 1 n=1 Tax=Megaselia scalaris TaxID=36166 RepID=T1GWC4_MEGSC